MEPRIGRVALAWAEAVTNIRQGHVPDEVFEKTRQHFSEKELANLTLAIATINAWNRLVISVRAVDEKYKPGDALSGKVAAQLGSDFLPGSSTAIFSHVGDGQCKRTDL